MYKRYLALIFLAFSFLLLVYVSLPGGNFPEALPDSLQSAEPADSETPLRRAYFTNLTREEVIKHYRDQFGKGFFTLRLNYPPEESQTIIRQQTKSTFLEEISRPLRESFFINGFEPKDPKDAIFIDNRPWRQKIIVRYIPSSPLLRVLVYSSALFLGYLLVKEVKSGKI